MLTAFTWHIQSLDDLTSKYFLHAQAFRRDDDNRMIAALSYTGNDISVSIHFPNVEAVTAIMDKLEDLARQMRELQEEAAVGSN